MVNELYALPRPSSLHLQMAICRRMGCFWSFPLMQYGNTWRTHRRLFHRFFNVSVVDQFDDKIYKAVNTFLLRLSQSPERFLKHVHLYVGLHSIQSSLRLRLIAYRLTRKPHCVINFLDVVWDGHRVRQRCILWSCRGCDQCR